MLYEVVSRIPIAITVVPANESDVSHFLSVIKKGIANVGRENIKIIVADRGFIDGYQLWFLKNKLHIDFVVPSKTNMTITTEARSFRKEKESKQDLDEWKYGKDICKGYGVNGLFSYIQYNDESIKDNKRTNGTPINAIVVTEWRGKKVSEGKEKVFITSLPVKNASEIAKKYRLRSYIENCGFRELKQASYLSSLPRRKDKYAENVAYLHIMLCVFAHTLFYTFLSSRTKGKDKETSTKCMRSFRRSESINETGKFIVFACSKYYAVFTIWEIFDIVGIEMKYDLGKILKLIETG